MSSADSGPDDAGGKTSFFQEVEVLRETSGTGVVVLAIEGMRPIGDEALHVLAGPLDDAVVRLRPRCGAPLRPADAPSAVASSREVLRRSQVDRPGCLSSIHVVTTAPVALRIELGCMLVFTVYRSAVVHPFDPQAARYVPVMDVLTRQALLACLADVPRVVASW